MISDFKFRVRRSDIKDARMMIIEDFQQIGDWRDMAQYLENCGQFTGLHDKNGKEIFEGEILFNNDRKEHCIVKYSQEKAMFIVKYLESNDEFPLWESISNLCYSVGNIYENQELLENKLAD